MAVTCYHSIGKAQIGGYLEPWGFQPSLTTPPDLGLVRETVSKNTMGCSWRTTKLTSGLHIYVNICASISQIDLQQHGHAHTNKDETNKYKCFVCGREYEATDHKDWSLVLFLSWGNKTRHRSIQI